MSTYEPPALEIAITRMVGRLLAPFYKSYARSLGLTGSEKVMDFGSGSGNLSRHLASILRDGGGELTCVDISHGWQMVIRQELRGFRNVRYAEGAIQNLGIPKGYFDAIVIHFVIHDIPARERAEIAGCLVQTLKPGGKLFVREPNRPGEGMPAADIQQLFEPHGVRTCASREVRSRLAGPMSIWVGERG